MKFVTPSVFLGCAAAVFVVAPQFKSIDNRLQTEPIVPGCGHPVAHVWQPFTPILNRVRSAERAAAGMGSKAPENPVMPKVDLPKQETLRLIDEAAQRHKVPSAFVKSIVAAESNFDCNVVSPRGAIGLMQLMPQTAEEYGADPTVPAQNIDAGTHYLRVLMDRYSRSKSSLKRVIAAYNAGPAMVDRYRGIPPFRETRQYVARVLNFMRRFKRS
jgi:soluble lytic murein transglycosylase-like protein